MGLFKNKTTSKIKERLVFLQYVIKYFVSLPTFYVDQAFFLYWLAKCFLLGRIGNMTFKLKGLVPLESLIRIWTEWTSKSIRFKIENGWNFLIYAPVRSRGWVE